METRKVIIYTRNSPTGTPGADTTHDMQETQCRRVAKDRGWEVVEPVYHDKRCSGRTRKSRPGLQNAINRAIREKGVFMANDLSRVARNVVDWITIGQELHEGDAAIFLADVNMPVDTSSAAGKLFWQQLAVFAEFFASQQQEKTRAGIAAARARGQVIGKLPYGHGSEPEMRFLEWIIWRRWWDCSATVLERELAFRGYYRQLRNGGQSRWSEHTIRATARNERNRVQKFASVPTKDWHKICEEWLRKEPEEMPKLDDYDVYVNRMIKTTLGKIDTDPSTKSFVVPRNVVHQVLDQHGRLIVSPEKSVEICEQGIRDGDHQSIRWIDYVWTPKSGVPEQLLPAYPR